ncbi:MAG: 4-diphosphocytidyl-2C-methyl-D-erythritol kinase [Gracilibacter sp. BRH_c7a]|nr:MAG: 4-diphosphocytidyl-2C-methyl-D-erythritol kinase [Gracilibacter sp. BRH_c7a]
MVISRIETIAPAKINLALAVTGLRADGFHMIQTVFQTISLFDRIEVELKGEGITCACGDLSGESNLAYKAAASFIEELKGKQNISGNMGITITIEKNIPLQAGLAGGSADAAAVLRGLNKLYSHPFSYEELLEIAASCGSDTAFCLKGGTQWGEGTGTNLTKLPQAPELNLLLVKPIKGVNTSEAYRLFDETGEISFLDKDLWADVLQKGDGEQIGKLMVNSLEKSAFMLVPEIKHIKELLLEGGCWGALMSGSGSAVFGILPDIETGIGLTKSLVNEGFLETWIVKTIV